MSLGPKSGSFAHFSSRGATNPGAATGSPCGERIWTFIRRARLLRAASFPVLVTMKWQKRPNAPPKSITARTSYVLLASKEIVRTGCRRQARIRDRPRPIVDHGIGGSCIKYLLGATEHNTPATDAGYVRGNNCLSATVRCNSVAPRGYAWQIRASAPCRDRSVATDGQRFFWTVFSSARPTVFSLFLVRGASQDQIHGAVTPRHFHVAAT